MADVGVGTKAPTTLTNGTSAASTSSESDKENMPNTLSCDFDTLYKNFLENVAPPGQMKSWDSSSASSSRLDPLTENTPVRFTSSNTNPPVTSADDGKGMQQLNRLVKMMEQMCVLTEQNTKLREQANYLSAMKDLEKLRNENANKKCDTYGKFACDDDYYGCRHRVEEVVSEPESMAGEDINSARERSNIKRKGRSTSRNTGSKSMKMRSRSQGRVVDDEMDHGKKGILNFVHKITSKTKKQGTKLEDSKISKSKNTKGKDSTNYGVNEPRFEDTGSGSFIVDHSEPSMYLKKIENSDTEEVFDKPHNLIDSDGYLNTKESDLSTGSSNDELVDSPGKSTLQRRDHVCVRHKKVNLARQSRVTQDQNEPGSEYHSGHKRALSFDAIEHNDREPNIQMRKSDTQPDIQAGLVQQEQTNKEKQRRFIENKSASSDMLVPKPTSNEKRGKVTSGWDQIKYFIRNKPPGQSDGQLESREGPIEKRVTLATGTELSKEFPSTTWYVALGDTNQALARSVPDNVHKAELLANSPDQIQSLQKSLPVDFTKLMEEWDRKRLSGTCNSNYTAPEKNSNKKRKVKIRKDNKLHRNARNGKKDKTETQAISPDLGQRKPLENDGQLDVGQEVDMSNFTPDFKLKYMEWEKQQKKKQLVRVKSDSQADHHAKMKSHPQRSASTDLELVSRFITVQATPVVVQSSEGQDIVPIDNISPIIQASPDLVSNRRSSQDDHTADSESQNSVPSMNIASGSTATTQLKSEESFEDGILPDLVDTAESHITKLEEMNLLLANELHHKTANLQQITEEIQKMQEEIAQLGTDISVGNRMSDVSMGDVLEKELCNIKSEVIQLEERFKPTDAQPVSVKEPSEDVSTETQTQEKKADEEKSLEESLRERETLVKLLQSEISRQANEINYLRSHHQGSRRGKSFCSSERPGKKISKKRSNSDRIRRTSGEGKLMMQFSGAILKEEVVSVKVPTSKDVASTATVNEIRNTTSTKPSDRPLSCISTGAEHDGAISLTASGSSKYERPLSMISGCTVISERERPVSIASSLASSGSTRLEVTSDSTPSLETLHISAEDIRLSEILPESEEEKTSGKRNGGAPILKTHQMASRSSCHPHGTQPSTKSQTTDIKPSREIQLLKPLSQRHRSDSGQDLIKKMKETLKETEGKTEAPPLSPSKLTKIEPQIELVKLAKSPQSQRVDIGQKDTAQMDAVRQKPKIPEKKFSLEKRESVKTSIENDIEKTRVQGSNPKKNGVDRFSKASGKVVTRRATSDDIRSTQIWKDPMFSKRRDSFESLAKLSKDSTQSKPLLDHSSNQDENQVQNLKKKFMQHRVGKNITETPPSVNVLKPRSYRTTRELPKEGCVKQLSQAFSLGSLDETKALTGSTPQSLSPASSCSSIPVIGYSSTVATHIRRLKSRTTDSSFDDGHSERPKSDPKSNEYSQLIQASDSAHRKSSPDLAVKNQDNKPEVEESKPSPKKEKPIVPRKKPQSSKSVDNNAEDKRARRNGSVFTYTVLVDGSDDKSTKDQTTKRDLVSTDQKTSRTRLVGVKPVTKTEESVTFTVNKRTGRGRKISATENQNNNNTSQEHLSRRQRCSISDRKQLFEKPEGTVNKPSTPRNIAVEIKVLNNLALVGGKEEEDTSTKSLKTSSSPQASTETMACSGSEKSLSSSEKMPSTSPKKTVTKESEIVSEEGINKEAVVQRSRQRKPSSQESNNNQLDLNINNNNNNNENSIQPTIEHKRHKKNSKVERKESKTKHDVQKSGRETKAEKRLRDRKASTSKVEPSDLKSTKKTQSKERKSPNDSTEGVTNKRWSFTGKHKEDAKVDSKQTQNTDKRKKRSSSKQRSNGSTDSLFSKSRDSKDSKERSGPSSRGAEAQATSQQHRKGSTDSKEDGTSEINEPRERRSRIDRPSRRSRLLNKADRVPWLELIKRSPSVDGSKMAKDRSMKQGRPDLLERTQSVDRTITKREKSPSVERKGERSRSSWFSKKTDSITNFLRISKN